MPRRSGFILCVCALVLLNAACTPAPAEEIAQAITPAPTSTPLRVTAVPTANLLPSRTATLPPTATLTPSPTWTPSLTHTPTDTASPTPVPTETFTPSHTFTASHTPLPTETATTPPTATTPATATLIPSAAPGTPAGPTWTPPPANPAAQIQDHYLMQRPISNSGANWSDRTYPYGGTSGGRLQVHHGVDMVNPRGTPILAAAEGTVLWAGDDLTTLFGPYNNYYGNLVVLQHPFTTFDGQPVFTLYGHMDRVSVSIGQTVRQGETLGMVGGTGIAMGPHLHFEVRVGSAYDFGATRNPELWMRPYPTFGTLAGRVTDSAGNPLYSVTLNIESTDIRRYAFSYADSSVNPDPQFNENFVLGDIPANYYTVTVSENGRVRFRQIVYVYPNRTTWLNVQLN
jgi:murein DD-endopeptidase MepM/ murein hydrolase activator NlpD